MARHQDRDDPATHVPLAPAALHIVLALHRGERHGYGLMSDVADLSDGAITLGPGTLYGTLKKLVGSGLIEQTEERPDPTLDDQRRKYYRLTALGEQVHSLEVQRLLTLVERSGAAARLIDGAA